MIERERGRSTVDEGLDEGVVVVLRGGGSAEQSELGERVLAVTQRSNPHDRERVLDGSRRERLARPSRRERRGERGLVLGGDGLATLHVDRSGGERVVLRGKRGGGFREEQKQLADDVDREDHRQQPHDRERHREQTRCDRHGGVELVEK